MNYTSSYTPASVPRDGFLPIMFAPVATPSAMYRAVIIVQGGTRTAHAMLAMAPRDIQSEWPDLAETIVLFGARSWFAPFGTSEAMACCLEPIGGVGNFTFRQLTKWLRKQPGAKLLAPTRHREGPDDVGGTA